MAKTYDKKVHLREFGEMDLVLENILPIVGENKSKWASNYKIPYVMKKRLSQGILIFSRMDGEDLPKPINSNWIKKY